MQSESAKSPRKWALVLGASSGFGAATARALSLKGYNIIGVHLDRSSTIHLAEEVKADIEAHGCEAVFINRNAARAETRQEVVQTLADRDACLHLVMHSLAFGTLRPLVYGDGENDSLITKSQLEMTLDVMANSLVYWVQDLVKGDVLAEDSRVFAMTSSGSTIAWPYYGAVSAAKSALESYVRQLAVELAPLHIAVNAVRAGVTDTPALRKIPGHDRMIDVAKEHNPHNRLTTPEEVSSAIVALVEQPYWMTGNVINVDGGEAISG